MQPPPNQARFEPMLDEAVCYCPCSRFTATVASVALYSAAILVIVSQTCPMKFAVLELLIFMALAIVALVVRLAENACYRLGFVLACDQFIYCGSMALVLYKVLHSVGTGFCRGDGAISLPDFLVLGPAFVAALLQLMVHFNFS